MIGVELEERFIDAIQDLCRTDEAKEEAKVYFDQCIINDMIDEALEEF